MTFIGIDFSINSTAVCIIEDEKEEIFYSFNRGQTPKKYLKIFEKYQNINILELDKMVDLEDLSVNELVKLDEAIKLANLILENIIGYSDIIIGIENFSYNGLGRRSLDLAGFQYILRERIFKKDNIKDIRFFTPSGIKKFAYKGNASKEQMMESYLKIGSQNDLTKFMEEEEVKKNSKFPKPVDDLVDSWYIAKMLQKNYKN